MEREETEERTEKRPQTDTDTGVESTQSRQKNSQMKSIFQSNSRNLSVNTGKKWFETTRYGKLTHTKSGQPAVKSTERQTWL